MLGSIRDNLDKLWVKVLLGLVALSFIFVGLTSGDRSSNKNNVAKVNGEPVSRYDLDLSIQRQQGRFGEIFEQLYPTDADKKRFATEVLEQLINSKALIQQLSNMGLSASEDEVNESIKSLPFFQENGRYSPDKLKQVIAANQGRLSLHTIQREINEDIMQKRFEQIISDTEFALPYETSERLQMEKQKRDAQVVTIEQKHFEKEITVSDEELQGYYQEHMARFKEDEKVSLEYVELDMKQLIQKVTPLEEDIKTRYEENIEDYKDEEKRRASHILIKISEEKDEAAARKEIDDIAKKVAEGGDFAELAKEFSQDFSSEKGGDLGFAGRGVMESAFEEAIYALAKVGDVSGVVKTQLGFHLIKLMDIQEESVRPLASVRQDIVSELQREEAESIFYEKLDLMREQAFEHSDSLQEVAAALSTDIKTSPEFSKRTATGLFVNNKVLTAAFSNDVLHEKRNSEVIELTPEHAIVIRLKNYQEEKVQAFDEVKEEVTKNLTSKKLKDYVTEKGQNFVKSLQTGETIDAELNALNLTWKEAKQLDRNSYELGREVTQLIFQASKPTKEISVAYSGFTMSDGNFVLIGISNVTEPQLDTFTDVEKQQIGARIVRDLSNQARLSIVKTLRSEAEIKVYEENLPN